MNQKVLSCYGKYKKDESCRRCRFRRSCCYYTDTVRQLDKLPDQVSFENLKGGLEPAASMECIPGYESEADRPRYSLYDLMDLLRYLITLDRYTLVILREMLCDAGKSCTVSDLVKRRKATRQSVYRKICRTAKKHPELERIMLSTLTRKPTGAKHA